MPVKHSGSPQQKTAPSTRRMPQRYEIVSPMFDTIWLARNGTLVTASTVCAMEMVADGEPVPHWPSLL
jgi:hypothetical protein